MENNLASIEDREPEREKKPNQNQKQRPLQDCKCNLQTTWTILKE